MIYIIYSLWSGRRCRRIACLVTLATIFTHSAGELTIAPRNTESKVGDITYFNCSTYLDSAEIFWYHGDNYIYNGYGILEPYHGRFQIDRKASKGSHNLVINSVEASDAGEYICVDDDGYGTRRSAELVVLDNDPDCQSNIQPGGVIGQNIFNIPLDEVQLTCNVTYHGNIPPQMELKKIGENRPIKDNVTSIVISNNRLIYTLKLKGDIALDRSSYVCQTTKSTQDQFNCTFEIIKVLYFVDGSKIERNVVRGDNITCIARNNTFPCISQWYHDNYTHPFSTDETITAHLLGEYLCTVKCHVRGGDYYFEALKAFIAEPITPPTLLTSDTNVIAIVVPIVIIFISTTVIAIAVFIVCLRKNRKQLLGKSEEDHAILLEKLLSDEVTEDEVELRHKIKANPKEKEFCGVAILNGYLFVAREESSDLEVYNCNDFQDSKLLKVEGLVSTIDVCFCSINTCLYILDDKDHSSAGEILRINSEGKVLNRWLTKDGRTLSAGIDGNVVMTAMNVTDEDLLVEYSPNGDFLLEIKLPCCPDPLHAIKVDNGRYIVSHCDVYNSNSVHRLCLVDEVGNVEKSFGRGIGSEKDQLNDPRYFAVGKSGYVIVADYNNHRMLLLDSNLEFKTKIVSKYNQRLIYPYTLCLSETLLVVLIRRGDPNNLIMATDDSRKETEEVDTSTKSNEMLIEEDCRLLVFDIEPLLQKYIYALL